MNQLTKDQAIKLALAIVIGLALLSSMTSCSRYVSVEDAANGKARCGQRLR